MHWPLPHTLTLMFTHFLVLALPAHLYMYVPQLFTYCLPTIICVMLMFILYVL